MILGDKTFKELGLRVRQDSQNPFLSQTRDIIYTIPGRHGAYDFGAELESREFSLECDVVAKDPVYVQKKAREFTSHLLDKRGKPKTLKLVTDVDPDKFYWVRYAGDMPADRLYHIGRFTLPLTAHDPYAYADMDAYDPDETYEYDTGLQYDSCLMYPNPAGFSWRYINHYSIVYNYYPYHTPFLLTIKDRVIDPRIENNTNAETIILDHYFQHIFQAEDGIRDMTFVADIDSETYFLSPEFPAQFREEVLSGNLIEYQRGSFIMLEPGQNDLHFYGGNPDATVIYQWLHRFM